MSITYCIAMFPDLSPVDKRRAAQAEKYAGELSRRSGTEIVIRGRLLSSIDVVQAHVCSLKRLGFKVTMYTGAWGGVDLTHGSRFLDWAQRNEMGKPLGYQKSLRSGMLCPLSPYVEEVLVPELRQVLSQCDFDGLFFDIPWIMGGGCHCKWCEGFRRGGRANGEVVRHGALQMVKAIRKGFPNVDLAVNAGAPGLNQDERTGGHIRYLARTFDRYVTEWNPYRWAQSADVVRDCILSAKQATPGRFHHASTLTTNRGALLSAGKLRGLFASILSSDASPWLSVHFREKALDSVHEAYVEAAQDS